MRRTGSQILTALPSSMGVSSPEAGREGRPTRRTRAALFCGREEADRVLV
jgi:hypothetical protein